MFHPPPGPLLSRNRGGSPFTAVAVPDEGVGLIRLRHQRTIDRCRECRTIQLDRYIRFALLADFLPACADLRTAIAEHREVRLARSGLFCDWPDRHAVEGQGQRGN